VFSNYKFHKNIVPNLSTFVSPVSGSMHDLLEEISGCCSSELIIDLPWKDEEIFYYDLPFLGSKNFHRLSPDQELKRGQQSSNWSVICNFLNFVDYFDNYLMNTWKVFENAKFQIYIEFKRFKSWKIVMYSDVVWALGKQ
jgi:hypothetical protein